MAIPSLTVEDIARLEGTLRDFLQRSSAHSAIVTDTAGFVLARQGAVEKLDTTTLGALSANSYAASAAMAGMIGEPLFSSLYQEGSKQSLLINALGDSALLVAVFDAKVSGGAVKYYAAIAGRVLVAHIRAAAERSPNESLDLATLNVADTEVFFRRKG